MLAGDIASMRGSLLLLGKDNGLWRINIIPKISGRIHTCHLSNPAIKDPPKRPYYPFCQSRRAHHQGFHFPPIQTGYLYVITNPVSSQ